MEQPARRMTSIKSPEDAYEYAKAKLQYEDREHFAVIVLDVKVERPAKFSGSYWINWNLSIPFVCQLWTTIKLDQTAILKAFPAEYVLHYFVFFLRIQSDCVNAI